VQRTLTAFAALAATAVTLAAGAAAAPVQSKQRVMIQLKGASFVLTPLTSGAIKRDTGTVSFCCWSQRSIVRDGQAIDINDPQMTLTGERGNIVARNRIEWSDLPDGWAVFSGAWKVVRATGAYSGLSGGGRGAGTDPAGGKAKAQFEGFLVSR